MAESIGSERRRGQKILNRLNQQMPGDFDMSQIVNQLLMCSTPEEQDKMSKVMMSKDTVNLLYNIIISRSRFGSGTDEFPIGLSLTTFLTSQKLQETLNVKRLGNVNEKSDAVKPKNIFNVLHSKTMELYWIRIKGLDVKTHLNGCVKHVQLNNFYHEYYFASKPSLIVNLKTLCDLPEVERIIFISDLRLAKESFPPIVSYAMIYAFLVAYWSDECDLVVRFKQQSALLYLQMQASIFMHTNNIVNVPDITPLSSTSTERAMQRMEKIAKHVDENEYHPILTPRCFVNIGESMGSGARTTGELILPLNLDAYVAEFNDHEKSRTRLEEFMKLQRTDIAEMEKLVNKRDIVEKEDFDLLKLKKYELNAGMKPTESESPPKKSKGPLKIKKSSKSPVSEKIKETISDSESD